MTTAQKWMTGVAVAGACAAVAAAIVVWTLLTRLGW